MLRRRGPKSQSVALPEDDSDVEDFGIPVRDRKQSIEDDSASDAPPPKKRGPIGVKDMPGASDQEVDEEEGGEQEEEDEEGDEDEDGDV